MLLIARHRVVNKGPPFVAVRFIAVPAVLIICTCRSRALHLPFIYIAPVFKRGDPLARASNSDNLETTLTTHTQKEWD
jgi:hypothetical protein